MKIVKFGTIRKDEAGNIVFSGFVLDFMGKPAEQREIKNAIAHEIIWGDIDGYADGGGNTLNGEPVDWAYSPPYAGGIEVGATSQQAVPTWSKGGIPIISARVAPVAPPVAAASVDTLPEKECLGGDEAYGDRVYGFTEDQMIAWGAQQRAMQQEENNGIMREWAQRVVSAEDCAEKAEAELANKQAIIDRLMLEYCPDEMTAEQMAEWASHQKRAE